MQYREFQPLRIIAQGGDFPISYCFPDPPFHSLVTTCFEGTMSLSQKISVLCHLLCVRSPQRTFCSSKLWCCGWPGVPLPRPGEVSSSQDGEHVQFKQGGRGCSSSLSRSRTLKAQLSLLPCGFQCAPCG